MQAVEQQLCTYPTLIQHLQTRSTVGLIKPSGLDSRNVKLCLDQHAHNPAPEISHHCVRTPDACRPLLILPLAGQRHQGSAGHPQLGALPSRLESWMRHALLFSQTWPALTLRVDLTRQPVAEPPRFQAQQECDCGLLLGWT